MRWSAWLIAGCVTFVGCAGGDFEPFEPVVCEPVPVNVEDTCPDFCTRVVGECDAFVQEFGEDFDEADCRVACETDISEAAGCSIGCGITVEQLFRCVADTDDCQDVFDWRDARDNDHACRDAVDTVGRFCPF